METFFTFIRTFYSEILLFLGSLIVVFVLIQWFCWIFSLGRFKDRAQNENRRTDSLRYLFADLLVKIINDFRHLLALIIVLIFAGVLLFGLSYITDSSSTNKVDDVTNMLQAVVASLGGIVGSIIGYYFGESVAQKRAADVDRPDTEDAEQEPEAAQQEPITPAPRPPSLQADEDKGEEEGTDHKENDET